MFLETSKIREHVLKYCVGNGIDLGCGRDPITPDCVAMDDDPAPGVNFVGNIAKPLPFPDNHFDWVYSSHALEDIQDTGKTLQEWVRVLKPAGHIILYVPHPRLYKGHNSEHFHPGFCPETLIWNLNFWGCELVEALLHDIPRQEHPCHSSLVVMRKI